VVDLPPTMSKKEFLQDLDYYCFQGVDPSSIAVMGSLKMFSTGFDHIDKSIHMFELEHKSYEVMQKCTELAIFCLRHYKKTGGNLKVDLNDEMQEIYANCRNYAFYKEQFSIKLACVGLKLKERVTTNSYRVKLDYV